MIHVLVQTASGRPMAIAPSEGFVPSDGFHVVEYVPMPCIRFDGSPAPETHLAALRRLVGYARASATETLRRGHSAEEKHRAVFIGRSDGFQAMADALFELVQLMELGVRGVVPLKPMREPEP